MVEPPDSQFCAAALHGKPLGTGLNNRQPGRRPGPRRSGRG